MAAYILFGVEAQHLLTAVIMTAPGTLMMAKLFVPETGEPETMGTVKLRRREDRRQRHRRRGRGTGEGLHLALNVGAMLISFLALMALLNAGLGLIGDGSGVPASARVEPAADSRLGVRADRLGLGVPWQDAHDGRQPARDADGAERVRGLFAARPAEGDARSASRSRSRRSRCAASPTSARSASRSAASARWRPSGAHDLARLGLRAMLAGTFANFLTATIAGMLL